MENVVHVVAIARTLRRLSALHAQSFAACRAHALAVQEPYGIWGGLSEDDRAVILERRGIPLISHAS